MHVSCSQENLHPLSRTTNTEQSTFNDKNNYCSLERLVHCLEVAVEDGVHLRTVLRAQELALGGSRSSSSSSRQTAAAGTQV
jgi:hypothetical protein